MLEDSIEIVINKILDSNIVCNYDPYSRKVKIDLGPPILDEIFKVFDNKN